MIKMNWADHCSSDDEEDHSERIEGLNEVDDDKNVGTDIVGPTKDDTHMYESYDDDGHCGDSSASISQINNNDESNGHEHSAERQYQFPTDPPYTAFVGNLSFQIKDPQMFGEGMIEIVRDKLGLEITILEAKIIKDRTTDRPRGFGYIEVESLEILQKIMGLNEIGAVLAGRSLKFDTANQGGNNRRSSHRGYDDNGGGERRNGNRSSNFGDIDGSSFRGGKYQNQYRASGKPSSIGNNESGQTAATTLSPSAPAQRPKLILQPRSIPLEEKKPLPTPKEQTSTTQTKTQTAEPVSPDSGKTKEKLSDTLVPNGDDKQTDTHNSRDYSNRMEHRSSYKESNRQGREEGDRSTGDDWRSKRNEHRVGRGQGQPDAQRRSYVGRGRSDGNNSVDDRRNLSGKANSHGPAGRFTSGGRSGRGREGAGRTNTVGRSIPGGRGNNSGRTAGKGAAVSDTKDQSTTFSEENKIKKTFTPPVEQTSTKPVEKQTNSFAALGFDSDSD